MICHVVMWKFQPGTQAQQAQFFQGLRQLQGVIPSLVSCRVEENVGPGDYDAVLIARFHDLEGLEAYRTHPRHQEVSALCWAIRVGRASVDFVE